MKRIGTTSLGLVVGLMLMNTAFATPLPNSAVIHARVFNDCPISVLSTTNLFPGLILVCVNNTPIQLGISYFPNGLSSVSPAQIVSNVRYNSINYTSGLLNFDEGNPAETPPHGLWGALTPWYAGGHVKMFCFPTGVPHGIVGTWNDIQFLSGPTPAAGSTWGRLKAQYH